nr:sugar ABC transporter ATP-binding protein [uncultured Marvinbryantia sp.]
MRELTIANQQMIEIVRAIAFNAKIIIMDEPTSSLTEVEIQTLFSMIRKLVAEGKSVIYISHRMDEIFEIADMVTVIRDGRTIDTVPVEKLDKVKIIKMMVGRELEDIYNKKRIPFGEERLRVEGLTSGKHFQNINFSIRAGEIVGLMGLVGAGRSEVAETIFGLRNLESGQIYVSGRKVDIRKPWRAINAGIAFITEDRKRFGISRIHSVRQNIVLASLGKYAENFLKVVSVKKEKRATDEMIRMLNIKTPDQKFKVGNLSGGNQQKVVVGKWLLTEPDILIMDEPTRGIDVGAKSEIYAIMTGMAESGKSILMISSEMQELMGMCDRIVVMCAGKQTGIFERSEFNQFKLMACAAGETKEAADRYEN